MTKAFERRLAAVERRLMPRRTAPQVIVISGGFSRSEPMFASAAGLGWEQAPDESYRNFEVRVVAAAAVAGKLFVVIGGFSGAPHTQT